MLEPRDVRTGIPRGPENPEIRGRRNSRAREYDRVREIGDRGSDDLRIARASGYSAAPRPRHPKTSISSNLRVR